jgi:hypothetical protein
MLIAVSNGNANIEGEKMETLTHLINIVEYNGSELLNLPVLNFMAAKINGVYSTRDLPSI